jgi:beta-mannanase
MLKILVTTALAIAVLAGVTTEAETTPRSGPLFGLNVPSLGALDDAEATVGARAAIVGPFADWAHTPDFPRALADRANARGAVLLISWEPWDSARGGAEQATYALDRIVAGDHDALIDRWAAQVVDYDRPVMLRFAAEMNGDWLPWSTGVNGNDPGDYVAAWRHVRERFRRAGAANAVWVWNPIAAYDGATPLPQVFPGTDAVDWVAVDGYNWGATRGWGWQSYSDIFTPTIAAFRQLAPGAPVMISETGCAPDGRKAAWITRTMSHARADGVDALVWFEFAKETDRRLSETPETARAARTALRGPGWRQGGDLAAIERAVSRSR